jgi:AcrR family transcriptional regulator
MKRAAKKTRTGARAGTKRRAPTLAPPTPDRRARIVDAAIDEFAARGFEAASTNAIAESAGVAKGLVYHYFGDKEALFLAAAAEVGKCINP